MTDTATSGTPANVADVEEVLRDVVDPELGINVVDLPHLRHHRGLRVAGDHRHDADLSGVPAESTLFEDQAATALEGYGFRINQLDAAVGTGQDHRGRSRAAAGARLQFVTTRRPRGRAGASRPVGCRVPRSARGEGDGGLVVAAAGADGASAVFDYFPHDLLGVVLVRRGGYAVGLVRGDRSSRPRSGPGTSSPGPPRADGRSSGSRGAEATRRMRWSTPWWDTRCGSCWAATSLRAPAPWTCRPGSSSAATAPCGASGAGRLPAAGAGRAAEARALRPS